MTGQTQSSSTVDPSEIAKFTAMADDWWDPQGKFKPLHRLNRARLSYLRDVICQRFGRESKASRPLDGLRLLDLGCGGGLISEPMTRLGAQVVGADMTPVNIEIAKSHAASQSLNIDYRHVSAESLVEAEESFDVVLALEIIEHVADVDLFIDQCCRLVRPGGVLIFSTINRTPKAYAMAIIGAEYVMRWLPKGTHEFDKFVRPEEIASQIDPGVFNVNPPQGLSYDLFQSRWQLSDDTSVNYFLSAYRNI